MPPGGMQGPPPGMPQDEGNAIICNAIIFAWINYTAGSMNQFRYIFFSVTDPEPFDLDRDLSAVRVASEMGEATRAAVSPFAGDASLVIRITTLMSTAFFDALAPYHPTGN